MAQPSGVIRRESPAFEVIDRSLCRIPLVERRPPVRFRNSQVEGAARPRPSSFMKDRSSDTTSPEVRNPRRSRFPLPRTRRVRLSRSMSAIVRAVSSETRMPVVNSRSIASAIAAPLSRRAAKSVLSSTADRHRGNFFGKRILSSATRNGDVSISPRRSAQANNARRQARRLFTVVGADLRVAESHSA